MDIPETSWSQERYSICKQCKDFNDTLKLCKNCGCFMPVKVRLPLAKCPVGKWSKQNGEREEG